MFEDFQDVQCFFAVTEDGDVARRSPMAYGGL
jgi:hypothetical protein